MGVCKRCHDKIEWRKNYRKYKPLSQPSKCNLCQKKNVIAAYHTICSGCAVSKRTWDKMQALKAEGRAAKKDINNGTENNAPDARSKIEQPKGAKVCSMCCKEKALSDACGSLEMDQQIEEAKLKMEEKLGRPLKLREQKAIERKIERALEKEKQRAKEERRRLREEGENKGKETDIDDNKSNEDHNDDEESNVSNGGSNLKESHSDDEGDEFLQKVGGKILTGENYQKMLLQREKQVKFDL